ncbi:addiction module protein [Asticcacaulis sp. YBE204]|uniref:addiction module protein n=1 Tax=Asticcacaulis sp. YBE204 TaxID=1282363 RepID=UPI0003C3F525|nr:addiction module protein [Asticcacaulis sp. YBE204]ESQ78181.1 hypothetical protein AEYBE204_15200 [Asticcacaulis sp. YBE204]
MNAVSKISIADLTVEERLELIEALWDSLEDTDIDLTPAQKAELDRRLDNIDAGKGDAMEWETFRSELRARHF